LTITSKSETAILVAVNLPEGLPGETTEHLDELEFLAHTAGAVTLKRFTQNLPKKHPKFFVGPGKLDEIKKYVEESGADMVIFDDELTPSQIKNIEITLECKILDRTNLILDIFAARAQTAQARTQVDLAQCQYLLPRLTRLWTHLSRQKGGIGMKGPGEKEIETDRRIIRQKISLLKDKLEKIDKQNVTRRKARKEKVRISLVGYTNAGKSTLMNKLSDAEVLAENKLFATLDTTVRKVVVNGLPFLLSDTVGFIRKLPHTLIESFKSTLDEVIEADILLHIVDISHPTFEHQVKVVQETLEELKSADKPTLIVFNKIDKYIVGDNDIHPMDDMNDKAELLAKEFSVKYPNSLFISASLNFNIKSLRQQIYDMVKTEYMKLYPYNQVTGQFEFPENG
jgi:GTP-binding protein HflX